LSRNSSQGNKGRINHIPVLSCDSPQQQTRHDPSGALLLWMLQCKQGWSDTRDPVVASEKQASGWMSNAAAKWEQQSIAEQALHFLSFLDAVKLSG